MASSGNKKAPAGRANIQQRPGSQKTTKDFVSIPQSEIFCKGVSP